MAKFRIISRVFTLFAALCATGCMEYGPGEEEEFDLGSGVFVTCEGQFSYGQASLSYYDPAQKRVENGVFARANAMSLGDVAQSMTIHNGKGYVVVNNSKIIFVIDPDTFKVLGTIEGLVSPRYIHFVSGAKAYVTDLYDPRITIVDPRTLEITGRIEVEGHTSTERMVQWGQYVFVNCWSYDNTVLVVNTATDEVVDEIDVGIQPVAMAIDCHGKLWVLTDGGYDGSPYGHEAPTLYRIDAATRRIEQQFRFRLGDAPRGLCLNGAGDTLYLINGGVWAMDVTAERFPVQALVADSGTILYGLGVDPASGEIYVADAIDYQQPGVVYRYSAAGELMDEFYVGITPGGFCFKQ